LEDDESDETTSESSISDTIGSPDEETENEALDQL
jgi:hypothetical protein